MLMQVNQHTLKRSYEFVGKGLHTGKPVHMTVKPAPEGTGIRFCRTDLEGSRSIAASVSYVSSTARSTAIECGDVVAITIEHIMSALFGLGVDNAMIELDAPEVPILDGSAKPYVDAICADGLVEQNAPREYFELKEEVRVTDEKSGAEIVLYPSDTTTFEVSVDYGSKVLGLQKASWTEGEDYAGEVAVCRTFVFFHEIAYLFSKNLIKGGDVDNAIVIVENPVAQEELDRMAELFNMPHLCRRDDGYLNNLTLRFPNECARHKLLDLIGDLALTGRRIRARVVAVKPGHGINTRTARVLSDLINKEK